MLADPNPILIYKISEEETRVLVDVRGQTMPKDLRRYLIDNILPAMPGNAHVPDTLFSVGHKHDLLQIYKLYSL